MLCGSSIQADGDVRHGLQEHVRSGESKSVGARIVLTVCQTTDSEQMASVMQLKRGASHIHARVSH
jgi:hypothetical protein